MRNRFLAKLGIAMLALALAIGGGCLAAVAIAKSMAGNFYIRDRSFHQNIAEFASDNVQVTVAQRAAQERCEQLQPASRITCRQDVHRQSAFDRKAVRLKYKASVNTPDRTPPNSLIASSSIVADSK